MSDFEEEHPDFTTPDEMSSMTLVMEGQKLYVHKEVLAAWSPVFKSMFTRDFRGTYISISYACNCNATHKVHYICTLSDNCVYVIQFCYHLLLFLMVFY